MLCLWLFLGAALAQDDADTDEPVEAAPVGEPPLEPAAEADESAGVGNGASAEGAMAPSQEDEADTVEVRSSMADDPDAEEDADGYLRIVVIGEQQVRAARDRVARSFEELGWKVRYKRDGRVIFRGPEGWMGKAELKPTGDLVFSQPVIAFGGAMDGGASYESANATSNDAPVGGVGVNTIPLPGKKKVQGVQRDIRNAVHDDVMDFRRKIQLRYFSEYISELPQRLDDLWTEGISLSGRGVLLDYAARRAEVLDFWATRTDTPEGRTVSRTVEIWLRRIVMESDHPVTQEEVEAIEARRSDGRPLDIFPAGGR